MSNNRLFFDGMDEFIHALRNLSEHLAQEATGIVESTTLAAEAEIARGYDAHRRSGDLRRKLKHKLTRSGVSVTGEVRNSSAIANVFENGSQARHTDRGAYRGSMPPAHVFIPVMVRHRRRMYERLKDLLTREGLTVSGDA